VNPVNGLNLRQRWSNLPGRDRRALAWAAVVLGAVLLWQLGLAPAWATWRAAPANRAALQAQIQTMAQLQQEARALQAQSALAPEAAAAALQAALAGLGQQASASSAAGQTVITLQGVAAADLARLLLALRDNAQMNPSQARLQRGAGDRWSGTLVFVGLPS